MSEERKPVVCRCGEEMILCCDQADCGNYYAQYDCDCGWSSPQCEGPTEQEAIASAYAAATRTPPNRPLTLPELFDLDGNMDAVWVVDSGCGTAVMGAEDATEWVSDDATEWASDADTVLFFARKPTNADIAAARAGEGEEA